MAVLLFNDRGWTVAAAAWSAASKDGRSVEVCYQWGADGISWFDSATGNARTTLNITIDEFVRRVKAANGGVVDLRQS